MVELRLSDVTNSQIFGHRSKNRVIQWCNENDVKIHLRCASQYVGHNDFIPAFNNHRQQQFMAGNANADWNTPLGIYEVDQLIKKGLVKEIKWKIIRGGLYEK